MNDRLNVSKTILVPNICSQLTSIDMHLIRAYPLIVDLRLTLPDAESDWALLLEPVTYSASIGYSSAIELLDIRYDSC